MDQILIVVRLLMIATWAAMIWGLLVVGVALYDAYGEIALSRETAPTTTTET